MQIEFDAFATSPYPKIAAMSLCHPAESWDVNQPNQFSNVSHPLHAQCRCLLESTLTLHVPQYRKWLVHAGGVQISLEKESVAWSKGIMVMPPGVHAMLAAELGLLDRLAALELTVLQQPMEAGPTDPSAMFRCCM